MAKTAKQLKAEEEAARAAKEMEEATTDAEKEKAEEMARLAALDADDAEKAKGANEAFLIQSDPHGPRPKIEGQWGYRVLRVPEDSLIYGKRVSENEYIPLTKEEADALPAGMVGRLGEHEQIRDREVPAS